MEKDRTTQSEDPLPKRQIIVGIVYNLKKGVKGKTPDEEAEYDHFDTVESIAKAIESNGYKTVLLEADKQLPIKLLNTHIDIAFNIAEGFCGRGREAQIPALLNMYGIPYTGSDETTLCVALDKAMTKRLLGTYHIKSPKSQTISTKEHKMGKISFPVIMKPNAEGSSKGISAVSIAESPEKLKALMHRNLSLYEQNFLAEEYIEGREFTVGILGNGEETQVFRPMEIIYKRATQGKYHVYSYDVKQEYKKYVSYACPATFAKGIEEKMMHIARQVYDILECRDFARMDFRLTADNEIYFIEINPLPGLAPGYSDYPMLAEFQGIPYEELVQHVLGCALRRLHINDAPDTDSEKKAVCGGVK